MKEETSIGSTPAAENCQQVGTEGYDRDKAILECHIFIAQLRREFGAEPEGARLFVKSNPHDFGSYHEVNVEYDISSEIASNYAFGVEAETPEYWDEAALNALLQFGIEVNENLDRSN